MSKVNIEYDTESKKLKCMCDDEEMSSEYIGFYKNGDDQHAMEIGLKSEKKNGLTKHTRLMASQNDDFKPEHIKVVANADTLKDSTKENQSWFSKIINRN